MAKPETFAAVFGNLEKMAGWRISRHIPPLCEQVRIDSESEPWETDTPEMHRSVAMTVKAVLPSPRPSSDGHGRSVLEPPL